MSLYIIKNRKEKCEINYLFLSEIFTSNYLNKYVVKY